MKSKNWFAVKTLFLSKAVGPAREKDKQYLASAVFFEERIVLIEARNGTEAITLAEKQARTYAAESYQNAYGQKVVTQYLEACDAFEVQGDLRSGVEIFSASEVFEKNPGASALIQQKLGKVRTRKLEGLRKKFVNAETD